jgi:arylsulfatase A-like enzyme
MLRIRSLALVFGMLLASPIAPSYAAAPSRPNIVVIMADDLGYGDLGCYGATKIATPHCDRLAKEGRRFTDAHTPSGVCSPTRFGLLTGGYPWRDRRVPRHLHASEPLAIRDGEPTIASILKAAGYATACIGKWHLGAQRQNPIDWNAPLKPGPNDVGFDYFYGVINSHNQAPFVLVENDKILGAEADDPITVVNNTVQKSGPRSRDENALEALQTAKAVEFLEKHRDKPFFLYYPTAAVHSPVTPGKAWQGKSGVGAYGDYVQEFDAAVGGVLEALDRLKLTEQTIVVVTSDNGGIIGNGTKFQHKTCGLLRGEKGTAWEGGHRVPFLLRWPGQVPAGTQCDAMVSHVDLMATLCAAVDVPLPDVAGPDSFNVLPLWKDNPTLAPVRDGVVAVSQEVYVSSIRRGPWKLLVPNSQADRDNPALKRYFVDKPLLFNLSEDLGETNDLASAEPAKLAELTALLQKATADGHTRPGFRAAGESR